jgi:PII-like signaling protein
MADRMLQVHIRENDRVGGRPLYEEIVQRCRDLGIAGATVLRGLEGYGSAAEIHRGGLARHDLPVVVAIVDSEENLARLTPVLEGLVGRGAIVIEPVAVRRVRKAAVLP